MEFPGVLKDMMVKDEIEVSGEVGVANTWLRVESMVPDRVK